MIRIDAVWLAVEPLDMRAGADRLLASVPWLAGMIAGLLANGLRCPRRAHPFFCPLGFRSCL